MFALAILIGLYSYLIFFLGISGLLYKNVVFALSSLYFIIGVILFRDKLTVFLKNLKKTFYLRDKFSLILIFFLIVQIIVNFIGVLGPEIGFDALWYHLTLPKIYITYHSIFNIPGNLLYYSDMPKLTEMIYVPALMFGNSTLAKFTHFIFGILVLFVLYRLSRKFLPRNFSLLVLLVFYSNLVVGWETISAYIDLSRTFFELTALFGFIEWLEQKNSKKLILSALMLGFAVSAKVLALESLLIFLILLFIIALKEKIRLFIFLKNSFLFIFFSLAVPLPWFIFSFINTGNPLYPFFDNSVNTGTNFSIPDVLNFPKDIINLFLFSSDPISPFYLISVPLVLLIIFKTGKRIKIIFAYSLLALFFWYITPRVGGGRFILPYLPAFSFISVYAVFFIKNKNLKWFLVFVIFIIFFSSVGYRFMANKRFIPVILGKESKSSYLTAHLNFSYGDFYDTDGYFASHIKKSDNVLLYGFHNLYYVDFPFTDSTWVRKGDKFNYIATQNTVLPSKFNSWVLVYVNPVTHVKLYKDGGKEWVY